MIMLVHDVNKLLFFSIYTCTWWQYKARNAVPPRFEETCYIILIIVDFTKKSSLPSDSNALQQGRAFVRGWLLIRRAASAMGWLKKRSSINSSSCCGESGRKTCRGQSDTYIIIRPIIKMRGKGQTKRQEAVRGTYCIAMGNKTIIAAQTKFFIRSISYE